jgi:hypothetical protein
LANVTPEEAYAAIHDGIRYSGMGAWRDLMKPDDMWKVASFVARIRNLPPEMQQLKHGQPSLSARLAPLSC